MKTKKFSEIFFFHSKTKIKASEGKNQGNYPFYTSSNKLSKKIDKAIFDTQGLVFGTGGSPSIHHVKGEFTVSTDCLVAAPRDEAVETRYVYYFLLANLHLLEEGFRGAGIKHISKKYISNLFINYPDTQTQHQIIAALDKAHYIIDKRQKTIELIEELLRATYYLIFGDPLANNDDLSIPLIDYLEKIQIGPFGSQLHRREYISNGVPIINPVNIISKKINPNNNVTLEVEKFNSLPNYHLKLGDIIMARRGEMGRCGLVTENENGWFCGTGSLYLRPKNVLFSKFLLYSLTSNNIVKYLNLNAKGIVMKNLNKTIISGIPIAATNEKQVSRFNSITTHFEKLKENFLKSNKKSMILFNSLLQRAFHGDLIINIDLQLDTFIGSENAQAIEKDNVLIQRLLDRFTLFNQTVTDKETSNRDSENGYHFETLSFYEKAKDTLFYLLKKEKIIQKYNSETKETTISLL